MLSFYTQIVAMTMLCSTILIILLCKKMYVVMKSQTCCQGQEAVGYRLIDSTGSTVENTGPGLGSGVIINHNDIPPCMKTTYRIVEMFSIIISMQCWKFTRDSRRGF